MEETIFKSITESDLQTEQCGADFARYLLEREAFSPCAVVAMFGDLGVGKTAFVRGAASVLAPKALVHSPTYTIVNEYDARCGKLFHFDMYRICDEDELYSVGFWDYMEQKGAAFIEWSENIKDALPSEYYCVHIQKAETINERYVLVSKSFH